MISGGLALGLIAGLMPVGTAFAESYQPARFDPATDIGQDFTAVPPNSGPGMISPVFSKRFSNSRAGFAGQIWFAGKGGLWIVSAASQKAEISGQYRSGAWPSTGLMTPASGCNAGFGYGDFHWRAQIGYNHSQLHQGPGANLILWNADDTWIESRNGSQISEIDALETNYNNRGQAMGTFHFWRDPAKHRNRFGEIVNYAMTYPAGSDFTSPHDYDVIWTRTSLVLFIDGVPQLSAPPANVPKACVDGGSNKTLGAQMAMQAQSYDKLPTAQIVLRGMWFTPNLAQPRGGRSP